MLFKTIQNVCMYVLFSKSETILREKKAFEKEAPLQNIIFQPDGDDDVGLFFEHEGGQGQLVELLKGQDTPRECESLQ